MIEEIVIRDLGVIREAKLSLGPGLTVLTGETGAGKTMVLNALGLLLGERSDSAAVRKDQQQAFVEGRWILPSELADSIRESGIELEDNELILNRSVSSEGRSRAAVSGRSVPVGILSELGQKLVVVHGQADQIRLRSASAQREALDQFAGEALGQKLDQYRKLYSSWKQTAKKLEELTSAADSRSREAEEIRQAVLELSELDPKPGEDSGLAERAEKLSHLEDLRIAAANAHNELTSEGFEGSVDAITLVGKARKALEQVADHDPELAKIAQLLREIGFSLNESAANISGYLASLDGDSANELESIQQRRAQLAAAIKKYGPTLEDVISYLDSAGARLLELDSSDEEIAKLTSEEARLSEQVQELALQLSQIRSEAAAKLAEAVSRELAALAMTGASLEISVTRLSELGPNGADQVSILLSAYPGAEPRPLGKGASGGELSRIMLAIEVVLAGSELAPTFIFDEVDAGVGGAAATEVGKRLASLAKVAQVIVVTHLPQVAAFATSHLRVLKNSSSEYTATDVVKLAGEEVVEELARMLSGLSESESGKSHAKELLELAQSSL